MVYDIMENMPYEEMLGWFQYFKMRPDGWKEDLRASMIIQAQGVKESGEKLFPSLAAIRNSQEKEPDEKRTAQSLVASGWLAKFQSHAAKNNIEWKIDDQIQSAGDTSAGETNPEGFK